MPRLPRSPRTAYPSPDALGCGANKFVQSSGLHNTPRVLALFGRILSDHPPEMPLTGCAQWSPVFLLFFLIHHRANNNNNNNNNKNPLMWTIICHQHVDNRVCIYGRQVEQWLMTDWLTTYYYLVTAINYCMNGRSPNNRRTQRAARPDASVLFKYGLHIYLWTLKKKKNIQLQAIYSLPGI